MNSLVHWLTSSIRNKLMMITGTGTSLLLGASLIGIWEAWNESKLLPPDHTEKLQQHLISALGLMGVAILLAFIAFLWLVKQNITAPARQLAKDLDRLANGDFTTAVTITTHDEFGDVATNAENIRRELGNIIQHVKLTADKVSIAASALANTSQQVVNSSQRQSDAAASTAATVEQVTVSINSVADNAESVRDLSRKSLEYTETGSRRLVELSTQVDTAVTAMEDVASAVNEFVANTSTITGMTQQVKDIADQTNLLALNAAIEAARAGEQGRGFAVVADEVRKLAEKSAQSANEIDRVTRSLSQQSEQVNQSIEHGRQLLRSSQENSRNTSLAMDSIHEAAEYACNGVDAIAGSVKEQNAASTDIAKNVANIASMAEENTVAVQLNAQAAKHLEELANGLEMSISKFRV